MDLILAFQGLGEGLAPLMRLVTLLGDSTLWVMAAATLTWCVDPRLGTRLAVLILLSSYCSNNLKLLIGAPRPFWIDERIHAWTEAESFAMPSGHAQTAAVGLGFLGLRRLRTTTLRALILTVILLVGISRIYLGVHTPAQVIAGWLIGAALLVLLPPIAARITPAFRKLPTVSLILAVLITTLALWVVASAILSRYSDWQPPPEWARLAAVNDAALTDALRPERAATVLGMLFGLCAGAVLLERRGGMSARGGWQQKGLRLLIGLAVGGFALVLPAVLQGAEATLEGASGAVVFASAAIFGGWVSGGAPLLFVRLGLAESALEEVARSAEQRAP